MGSKFFKGVFFLILAGIFIIIYALPLGLLSLSNSPDENANFTFSKLFAETSDLRIFAPENILAQEQISPRSVTSHNFFLVPGSFIGLPLLYGLIGKISISLIPFLTPFFAIFGVLAFFGIIRRVFSIKIAFFSSLLLLIHPAWWYWSSRVMMHNVLFISLLLIVIYFLIKITQSPPATDSADKKLFSTYYLVFTHFIAGIFIGLAILVRTSEIIWVAPLVIALIIYKIAQMPLVADYADKSNPPSSPLILRGGLYHFFAFLLPIIFIVVLLFSWNTLLYGSPLSFGYQPPGVVEQTSQVLTVANTLPSSPPYLRDNPPSSPPYLRGGAGGLFNYLLPFGFHPRAIWKNFFDYFVKIFWWWTLPLAYGLFHIAYKWRKGVLDKQQKLYVFLCLYVFVFLAAIYGSGRFIDYPDPKVISIGNSYVRYWLPLYILSLPFIAFALCALVDLGGKIRGFRRKIFSIFYLLFAICYFIWNAYYVLVAAPVSLLKVRTTLKTYQPKVERVLALTKPDSLVIASWYDKLFWPKRKVVFSLNSQEFLKVLPFIIKKYPVYYYSWSKEKDAPYLKEDILHKIGLTVVGEIPISGNEGLLEIKEMPKVM